jgi:hypothetical protein
MSRPHQPTDKDRATVRALLGYGVTQEDVSKVLKIDIKTLAKHYPHEIDTAQIEANAAVAQSLFVNATKKDNVAAQIFWLKTRARWKEPVHIANAEDGTPFIVATGVPRPEVTDD